MTSEPTPPTDPASSATASTGPGSAQHSHENVPRDADGHRLHPAESASGFDSRTRGVLVTSLSTKAQAQIAKLVALFVANMDLAHAAVKAREIYAHRSETYFQWIGGTGSTDPFYFRIHSPVVWIEFDCETPGPIGQGWGAADTPSRQHIHSDVRTPNGNDYGRSLLALHLALDH